MIKGLNHITLAVSDLDVSLIFYMSVMDFKLRARWNRGAYLSLGDIWLCLSLDNVAPAKDYSHIAFTVMQEDFSRFSKRIFDAGVNIWKENMSEGDSLYILDPDGHKLEVHVGNLESRLRSLQLAPYEGLNIY